MVGTMLLGKLPVVLMSAVFLSTVTAHIVDDIIERLDSETQVEFCPLDPSVTLLHCTNSEGDPVTVAPEDGWIPAMSVCMVETEHGETVTMTCLRNGLKIKTRYPMSEKGTIPLETSAIHRPKRGFWVAIIPIVAAVLGAGTGAVVSHFLSKGTKQNTPPTIRCGSLLQSNPVIAKKGEYDAAVNWSRTTAYDQEDESLTVHTHPEPQRRYSAGYYDVQFTAYDSKRAAAFCSIQFQVKVYTCPSAGWPRNGRLACTHRKGQPIYGTTCNIVCDTGYKLPTGAVTSIECTIWGTWDRGVPDCSPIKCNPTPPVPHGNIRCPNGTYFQKPCLVNCQDGYTVSGEYSVECNKYGVWKSPLPKCKDAQSPRFTECTRSSQVDVDGGDNMAYVTLEIPTGTDNAGTPTIVERNNKTDGRYPAGNHIFAYDITDAEGNQGQSCVFSVDVQTQYCEAPNLKIEEGEEYMEYICPDLYQWGAECRLACGRGYPLIGANKIKCENVGNTHPPTLRWRWDQSELNPYCKDSRCVDLDAPANGAITCALWDYGNACTVQCQKGFDTTVDGDVFVCANNGDWLINSSIPDCVERIDVSKLKLDVRFSYYTGKCNSSEENRREIQENFINRLNSSSHVYNYYCRRDNSKCQRRFVSITCGPITSGNKDAIHTIDKQKSETFDTIEDKLAHTIEKRQAEEVYTISFDIVISMEVESKTASEARAESEQELSKMIDEIQTEIDSGKFNIAGLEVKSDSLNVGSVQLDCLSGMEARDKTASCAGCGYGRFYNTSTSGCELCPIGTYQDQPHAFTCHSCPKNTTTLYTNTKNISSCLSFCKPGEYSGTGLAPCGKCPSNSYQPGYRQTDCIRCPAKKRSEVMGATGQQQCQDYDVQLKLGKPVTVIDIDTTSTAMSIITWLYMTTTSGRQTLTSLVSSDQTSTMSVLYDTDIIVDINGVQQRTGVQLQSLRWTQLAVTIDSDVNTITMYINGNNVYTSSNVNIRNGVATGDTVIINADVHLSSYQMTSSLLTAADLHAWSSKCHFSVQDAFISVDNLETSQNAKYVVPSNCDAIDECLSSPCGSHGVCTNLHGAFNCSCTGGYMGVTCQIRPDPCLTNVCMNGATCTALATNYKCVCPYGYHGDLCEIKAVDGEMSAWSEWSVCSRSCDGGTSTRTRACDSPAPGPEGKPCDGNTTDTRICNEGITCPECTSLRRPHGATAVECNQTDTLSTCRIQCQAGYYVPEDYPPYYECGAVTNYTWSHQTDANPTARLPACSEIIAPTDIGYKATRKYGNLTCRDESVVLQQLNGKTGSMACASSSLCSQRITTNCTGHGNKQINDEPLSVTIALKSEDIPSEINIQELFVNNTASDKLVKLVDIIVNMETTAQEMLNDTSSFFNVTVEGETYSTSESDVGVTQISCKPGSAPLSALCADSPVGSYSDGLTVIMCPKGTYQDETGSTSCKPCPSGFITLEAAAESMDECFETSPCGLLSKPVNGKLTYSTPNENYVPVGSKVTYTCNTGYTISTPSSVIANHGSYTRTCGEDRRWTETAATCHRIVTQRPVTASSQEHSVNLPAIIGGAIGGLIMLVMGIIIGVYLNRKRSSYNVRRQHGGKAADKQYTNPIYTAVNTDKCDV